MNLYTLVERKLVSNICDLFEDVNKSILKTQCLVHVQIFSLWTFMKWIINLISF